MEEDAIWSQEKQTIKQIVDDCVMKISEHVDAVQIIITHHNTEVGQTMSYEKGRGNIHARIGVASEWVEVQKQYVKNWAIRKDQEEDGDGTGDS